ncbi:2-polyprenyl-6-methoxyphenol hydroxylase-like oxidoreductase [Mycobacterium bohemicum DSM 44277]|uniref:Oxidoreductase n=2 Tax=Mycobacterium bohemicum TaxID=56425 RepID=A0A1X1R0L5_MYCBE|nr:oxidoreductase [Mycobacterium bohemicum]MCV6969660.1 oxidoreductase [Mycobacterium bohemicum]ORU97473.1 oxidoreductase [Mycobacterium bohemicum]CPR12032.1 2-polyprenyl-6-methoxyphenol hydroxylase-like oxidoreductase [Mycobacterium bohemicum DSM 44277]
MVGSGGNVRDHAVVIGGSIAGLSAARVLADAYGRVTVYERDDLPPEPANRAAVPQDQHLHMLMARGAAEFERLFPGLLEDMVAAGVPILENRPDCIHLGAAGHVLGVGQTLRDEFTAYVPSRPHLEWQLRRRVRDIDNVEIVRRPVAEPRFDAARGRVTGVVLDPDDEFVPADLVVDAAGRGTRLPVWLQQWGYERPVEQIIDIGIHYATQRFRIPDGLLAEKVVVAGASHDQSLGLGMLFYEDGGWVLTTFGVGGAKPPGTFPEMLELARELLPDHFQAALAQAEPFGEPAYHAFPASRWRRYDKLDRFPAGIIPLGDAVASFNPTFGQGMTMTSLQAAHLKWALRFPDHQVAAALNGATARTTYPVWIMNGIADVGFHHAVSKEHVPWWWRPSAALFDQFLGAAETEAVLAEWFLRRFSLLDSLYMVPPPRIIGHAIRHNMRLWLRERREAARERAAAAREDRAVTALQSP